MSVEAHGMTVRYERDVAADRQQPLIGRRRREATRTQNASAPRAWRRRPTVGLNIADHRIFNLLAAMPHICKFTFQQRDECTQTHVVHPRSEGVDVDCMANALLAPGIGRGDLVAELYRAV